MVTENCCQGNSSHGYYIGCYQGKSFLGYYACATRACSKAKCAPDDKESGSFCKIKREIVKLQLQLGVFLFYNKLINDTSNYLCRKYIFSYL